MKTIDNIPFAQFRGSADANNFDVASCGQSPDGSPTHVLDW
jgi:hypothetical protein